MSVPIMMQGSLGYVTEHTRAAPEAGCGLLRGLLRQLRPSSWRGAHVVLAGDVDLPGHGEVVAADVLLPLLVDDGDVIADGRVGHRQGSEVVESST